MRITGIRLDRIVEPLDPPFPAAWDPVPRRSFAATIVRVETDEGVVGIGSGDTMDGFEAFAHLFVGQDPLRIARHVRALETIDSSGVGAIISLYKRLRLKGGDVGIARLRGQPKEIFRLLRLDRAFELYETLEQAQERFLARSGVMRAVGR